MTIETLEALIVIIIPSALVITIIVKLLWIRNDKKDHR